MVTKKHIDMLSTVSPEDLAKVQTLSGDEIAEALQQGREERRAGEACHIMQGPPGWRCSCGTSFSDYYGLSEHIRQFINCPRCGEVPANLGEGELYRWQCGHWIARNDASASIRAPEGTHDADRAQDESYGR